MRFGVAFFEAEGGAISGDALGKPSAFNEHVAEIVVRLRKVGPESNRCFKFRDCVSGTTCSVERDCEVVSCLGIIRVER